MKNVKVWFKKQWSTNRENFYFVCFAVLMVLAYFDIFSISVTIGPITLSLGSPY